MKGCNLRYFLVGFLVIGAAVALLFAFSLRGSEQIEIENVGSGVIEVFTGSGEDAVLIDPAGTACFDCNFKLQIGDAVIAVGEQVEVVNRGSENIEIIYKDPSRAKSTSLTIGQGGTGYVDKSALLKIKDAVVRVCRGQ